MGSTVSKDSPLDGRLSALGIPHFKPTSPEFEALHESFTGSQPLRRPGLIVRPQNPDHVAAVVRICAEKRHPLVIRGGGHDMFGRYAADGAVSIDLRDLNHVTVEERAATDRGQGTAWVQGGTTMLQLQEVLEKHGQTAAMGNCGHVGFVGWCLIGGLGPYMHSYGIGADQIISARVVNAQGKLVNANHEMLRGLRGGGGNLGVVTELQIKTYPFQEIQAGEIMYDSTDILRTTRTFLANYADLLSPPVPRQFSLQPQFWLIPGVGLRVVCNFIWNGPADDEYRTWLHKVADLAPLMPGSPSIEELVKPTTPRGFSSTITGHLGDRMLGGAHSATTTRISDDFINEMVASVDGLPRDGLGGLSLHVMRETCPSCTHSSSALLPSSSSSSSPSALDSVCPYRKPAVHVEILGTADDEEKADRAMEWAARTRDRLMALPNASKVTYFPLTAPGCYDAREMFGEKRLHELRHLKRKYDPECVFQYAMPRV